MPLLLGLDSSTTATKALLMDDKGARKAELAQELIQAKVSINLEGLVNG